MKIETLLPIEFHAERVRDMLAGSFNITPSTVGELNYHQFFKKSFEERFNCKKTNTKR